MTLAPTRRYSPWLLAPVPILALILSAAAARAQAADPSPAPAPAKKQLPADVRAFKAAQAVADPEKRLDAMRAFLRDYPKANAVRSARDAILTVLLDHFPEQTAEIDAVARVMVHQTPKGDSRDNLETYVAFLLAEAGPSGVDLPLAEKFAKEAVKHLNEPDYDKAEAAAVVKYKVPLPKPEVIHAAFANERADALAVLADVYFRDGKLAPAAALLDEAWKLDPLVDDVNSQRGRLALLHHDDALALESFERAQLVGAVSKADRETMMRLYRAAHGGSDAGFAAEMDAIYARLYPPPFAPAKPALAQGGHTVLLELFTGSACPPCVGGDLAVEGLLEAYPRSEVVALAFDQHIPEPDPLANPDSVARAGLYDIRSTPSYVLDGSLQTTIFGATRLGSEDVYAQLAKSIDAWAPLPSGIELKLSAAQAEGGLVHAQAVVDLPGGEDLKKALATKPKTEAKPAAPEAKAPEIDKKAAPVPPAPAPAPNFVVNFALVEDQVRYSGENGIRFHRMVVRALAKPADSGFAVTPAGSANLEATFDLAAISRSLRTYLDGFEKQNDRFGKIEFLSKDTAIEPSHLAVAAWVQDSVSHRVLQSAIVPVGEPLKGAE